MGRGPEDQSRPNGRAMLVPRAAWRRACGARASSTRVDLPRTRRWRGQACTAGAGPREAGRGATRRARERRRRRHARAGLGGVGRGTTCSGRSARSAQLGDDEGDHAARSASRGQEPTPSPLSTRVEDRDEPAAQARPGWRIETSLRRKGVRGGGSRRACGAKPSGVEDRDEPAARQCACGKRERRVQAEPLSHQARRYPSRASPYCPSEATRTTSRDWARRQIYESHLTQGGVRPTTFGVGFRRLSCGGGRPPPALVFNHLTLYAAWCRRCTGREYGPVLLVERSVDRLQCRGGGTLRSRERGGSRRDYL